MTMSLSPFTSELVAETARRLECSPFVLLLACFSALLHRYSRQVGLLNPPPLLHLVNEYTSTGKHMTRTRTQWQVFLGQQNRYARPFRSSSRIVVGTHC